MKINTSTFFIIIFLSIFLFNVHTILAQDNASDQVQDFTNIEQLINQSIKQGELAICSDYFKFNSVSVDLSADFKKYDAGQPIIIKGTLQNNSGRLITNLTLKARLIKDIPDSNPETSEFIVLDEFDLAAKKVIAANQQIDITESYVLPLNAPTGEYKILVYAIEDNSFDLSGIYFSNDITASTIGFSVSGEESDHIYLDQTQIKIADMPYNTSNPEDSYFLEEDTVITIPLYNPADEEREMNVTYKLYSWDSKDSSKIVDTKTDTIIVPANSEKLLSYTLQKSSIPVSYLSIIAEPMIQDRDTSVFNEKTISNIRLNTSDVSFAKLMYVGVDAYPLKRGSESVLVTCLADVVGQSSQSVSRIETILYDRDKNEIARTEYQGKMFPELSALIQKFKPSVTLSQFSIESRVYDSNNNIIDSFTKEYNCEDIDPSMCQPVHRPVSLPLAIALGGIVIALVVLLIKRKDFSSLKI